MTARASVTVLALLTAACGSSQPKPAAPTADATAPVAGRIKSADGVELAYEMRGKGDTALVFVHCWTCDRTYWKEQVDAFAKDYRVVTLDLAGHGDSGDARATWSIASLGADVQAVVDALGLKRVILVGHSMGGPVSLDAARRLGDRVAGVVCADTLHDTKSTMPPEMRAQVMKQFETDFEGTMRQGVKFMFHPKSPADVVAWVTERFVRAKPAVALPLMREMMEMDLAPMLAAAKVPVRCINAAPYGPMSPATNTAALKAHADFDVVLVDGVGHFLQLEKPAEFNAKLRAILDAWK